MSRTSRFAFLIPVTIVAVFYALTLCRTIYFGDGLELTAASWVLGVAHPTGYPLYMLLGRMFLNLPLGNPGFRMNLLSAVSMLAATGLVHLLIMEFARGDQPSRRWFSLLAAALATAFGLSLFVWRHAVLTEVYGTFLVLFLTALWLLVRALDQPNVRSVAAAAFATGLAFQGHLLAVLLLPAAGFLVLRIFIKRLAPARALSLAALAFIIGICGYAYLPIRARQDPPMNWGAPKTLAALRDHLTGGQFKQTRILSDIATARPLEGLALQEYLRDQSLRILAWPALQFGGPSAIGANNPAAQAPWITVAAGALLWLVALGGLALLLKRRRWAGLAIAGIIVASVCVLILYTIADIEAYFLPLWPVLLALLGAIASTASRRMMPLLALLAAGLAVCAASKNFKACDLSDYRFAEEYGRALLDESVVPADSILVLQGDSPIFIAWYLQTVENVRPDVTLFGANFIVHDWYKNYFKRPQDRDFAFFTHDMPPLSQPDFLVALGGGLIIPNIHKRPLLVLPADPWLEEVLRRNWNGEVVADLLQGAIEPPPIPAALPSGRLLRLHDNPEYSEYQKKQFQEMLKNLGLRQ